MVRTKEKMKKSIFLNTNLNADGSSELLLYGSIGGLYKDGITAKMFADVFNKVDAPLIKLRINSPGGDVSEGIAIFNTIRNSRKTVDVYVDGIAASMGSVIALSGRKMYMSKSAMYMTHRVTGESGGDADDLKAGGLMLEQMETILCRIYADKTGKTPAQAKNLYLQKGVDKWFTADEAIKEGFCDGIYDAPAIAAISKKTPILKMWALHNRRLLNNNTNMKELIIEILGLDPAATDEDVVNAVRMLKDGEQTTKDGAKNMVAMAFAGSKISKEERDLCNELLKTNPAFVMEKISKISPAAAAIPSIVNLTSQPAQNGGKTIDKPKAQWTLNDYRRYAPGELASNRALYDKLCEKEGM